MLEIPDSVKIFYGKWGSYGNNTTIPEPEKQKIAREKISEEAAKLRGEQALDAHYQEQGLKPEGPWTDFTSIKIPLPGFWTVALREMEPGKLSKNWRNLKQSLASR